MGLDRSILSSHTARVKSVTIEDWGGTVNLRQMSYAEVQSIQSLATSAVDGETREILDPAALDRFNFALIQACWVDDDGERVLGDGDQDLLLSQPSAIVLRLAAECSRINGLSEDQGDSGN